MAIQTFEMPLNIAGSNTYGRYSAISDAQTFNMFTVKDAAGASWLVPFAGYKKVAGISENAQGRGIFNSTRMGKMIVVIGNGVYEVDSSIYFNRVGSLNTFTGDVYIAENDARQIAICDRKNMYIYDYKSGSYSKINTDFTPGYVAFQNGYFIASVMGAPTWRLSAINDGTSWPADKENVGELQGKPDDVQACIPVPSKMGALFVMGKTITEHWVDVGAQLFPYQRTNGFNIDYGCTNPSTIASGDNFVVWLATNEKSGAVIMYSSGGESVTLSDDGINYKLAHLTNPNASYGFLFRQDGKLFYVLTFTEDKFTLLCDLLDKKFYSLTNEKMEPFIAKRTVSFNDSYYFISSVDGNLYELSSKYMDYDGKEIPRIRVCETIRAHDNKFFIINNVNFTIEQGITNKTQVVDVAISKDGAASFSGFRRKELNKEGKRINRFRIWSFGRANSATFQFRFYGLDRFVIKEGIAVVYQ